jgi:Ca-activated chloride channel family protein
MRNPDRAVSPTKPDPSRSAAVDSSPQRELWVDGDGEKAPHPVPLPIGWGEGGRRPGEGEAAALPRCSLHGHKPFKGHAPTRILVSLLLLACSLWLNGCKSAPGEVSSRIWNPPPGWDESSGAGELTSGLRAERSPWSGAPKGSFPSADEELWVIARYSNSSGERSDDIPRSGSLMTRYEEREVALPLKHTDVQASICGYIGSVRVTQQFHNPYDGKIEALYVFPLPENAAVNEFVMTIGSRKIRGVIREKEEAEKIYADAKAQGYTASLLTQNRPNVFTQAVANIEPGHDIDVTLRYFNTLRQEDGWYEFVFPMVVGPRFNPPGSAKGVGAVARGASGASVQPTEVSFLAPGERSGHDIALKVDLDAGMEIQELVCKTHRIEQTAKGPGHTIVTLSPSDTVPNKDFVLRYRLAGDAIQSSMLTHHDERGGYFTLMLQPPATLERLHRQALELVFVLDCSGSMNGEPLAQAKAAIASALNRLDPDDTFQIIDFSNRASQLGGAPLAATPNNIRRGLSYLGRLNSDGGTMMIEGIKAALNFPHDPRRLRFVCFLTDGYIGNEVEILKEIDQRLGDSRIFSFGVGSAVNRYLMDSMATLGRGAVAYLGLHDDAASVMNGFFDRISHPALTDVTIDWDGMDVEEVFPKKVPDLFVGRPVILTGRFKGGGGRKIHIKGRSAERKLTLDLPVDLDNTAAGHEALPSVWARMKIGHLAREGTRENSWFYSRQIKQLALDYDLMSAFTAFVAVDASRLTEGRHGTTVPVAVPVPEGVRYENTARE